MIPINYLAVLACGIAALAVGFVWFGPLFGKSWMKMTGVDKATPEEAAKGKKEMWKSAALQFIGALVMAYVLAHGLTFGNAYLNTSGISGGLQGAFWYWLGFVAPVSMGVVLWEGKPWKLWLIVAGNWLVTLLIMSVILSIWP